MVRPAVKHTPATGSDLFSAAKEPTFTSSLFWVQILTYRPLLLLGSLWMVMICLSALAYSRLMFTEPTSTAGPTVTAEASLRRPPAGALDAGVTPSPSEAGVDTVSPEADSSPPEVEASQNSPLGTQVMLWGLISLVGLCGLGCMVISQQAKAAPKRRGQPKKRVRKAVKPTAPPSQPLGPKRLAPYSPQRDAVIVQGAEAVHDLPRVSMPPRLGKPTVAPHPLAQPTIAPGGELAQAAPPPEAASPWPPLSPAPTQHQPTVVPEDEAHPLDWPEASLAHSLDLRQRRSLSSLI